MDLKIELKEVQKLINKNWKYSAAIKLSELHSINKNKILIDPRDYFVSKDLSDIKKEAKKDYKKIINTVSFGNKWDEDELLLVFTYYFKLLLLDRYFQNFQIPFDLDFGKLISSIKSIRFEDHQKEIQTVKRLFSKNWSYIQLKEFNVFGLDD